MAISQVIARVRVEDLDAAVDFYEELTDAAANRFAFGDARLAAVGPFLLFQAGGELGERLGRVLATVAVDDIDAHMAALRNLGATIVAAPARTPNGQRMIATHPDGATFEYVGP